MLNNQTEAMKVSIEDYENRHNIWNKPLVTDQFDWYLN